MFWKTIYREQLNRSTYPARLPLPALDWPKRKGGPVRRAISCRRSWSAAISKRERTREQAHDV